MGTFAELEQAIKDLPADDFVVFVDTKNAIADAPVTPELAKLYAKWGFLAIEAKEAVWPRPKEFDVLPAWRFAYGFRVLVPAEYEGGSVIRINGSGLLEPNGDPIDQILVCIADLLNGVANIRKEGMDASSLMAEGRTNWNAPGTSKVLDGLKKRSPAELAPHVKELCDALLAGGRFTMGTLDVLAAAGPEVFRTVASQVYALEGHKEWIIQLLGTLEDTSPEAMARYRAALEGDDDDEIDKALDAVKALAKSPKAQELVPVLRKAVATWEGDNKARAIALLGHLGHDVVPLVDAHLASLVGDSFGALLRALRGLDVTKLSEKFLAQYRTLDPKDRTTLEAIEGLTELGIEDRATMEPTLRDHFVSRGGLWRSRAEAVLSRWR